MERKQNHPQMIGLRWSKVFTTFVYPGFQIHFGQLIVLAEHQVW